MLRGVFLKLLIWTLILNIGILSPSLFDTTGSSIVYAEDGGDGGDSGDEGDGEGDGEDEEESDVHPCDDERVRNNSQQVQAYCEHSEMVEDARDVHGWMIGPWTAVFGVCIVACVPSTVQAAWIPVCSYSSLAVGLADLGMTLSFAMQNKEIGAGMDVLLSANALFPSVGETVAGTAVDAVGSIGEAIGNIGAREGTEAAGGEAAKKAGEEGAKKAGEEGAKKAGEKAAEKAGEKGGEAAADLASCFSMVLAALQMYIHIDGVVKKNEEKDRYRDYARNFSSEAVDQFLAPIPNEGVDPLLLSVVDPEVPNRTMGGSGTEDLNPFDDILEGDRCANDNDGASCARALDRRVPRAINSREYRDRFKQLTGESYKSFGKKVAKRNMSFAQVAARIANPKDKAKQKILEKRFDKMARGFDKFLNGGRSRAGYAGGGKARSGNSAKKADLSSFFDRKPSSLDGKSKGVSETDFEKLIGKSSEEIAQDRSISLFYRVEFRHRKVKNRLEKLPYASIYNRATINGVDLD